MTHVVENVIHADNYTSLYLHGRGPGVLAVYGEGGMTPHHPQNLK